MPCIVGIAKVMLQPCHESFNRPQLQPAQPIGQTDDHKLRLQRASVLCPASDERPLPVTAIGSFWPIVKSGIGPLLSVVMSLPCLLEKFSLAL